MALKVIGAGFGRTGTKSLQVALKILSFGPCYHMETLIRNPSDVVYWRAAKKDNAKQQDAQHPNYWDTLFADYQSVVDFPACLFAEQLYRHFSGSKVILTVRDPELWYESALTTIYQSNPSWRLKLKFFLMMPFSKTVRHMIQLNAFVRKLIWQGYFSGRFEDKAFAIDVYCQHIEKIKAAIPEGDLLVFDLNDGWQPLCNFLQVPVPEQEFPQLNRRDKFNYWLNKNIGASTSSASQ